MPIYEYRCAEGHEFEVFQRINELPASVCPSCGAAVERLISAPAGFDLRGAGFYVNDYKNAGSGSAKNGAKAEKAGSPGAAEARKPAISSSEEGPGK